MHETYTHPLGDELGGALAYLAEPRDDAFVLVCVRICNGGKVMRNREIYELPQQRGFVSRSEQFEVAEANKGWRNTTHNRAGLQRGVTVVKHVALDLIAGKHKRQRTRRRYAKMMHRLGT